MEAQGLVGWEGKEMERGGTAGERHWAGLADGSAAVWFAMTDTWRWRVEQKKVRKQREGWGQEDEKRRREERGRQKREGLRFGKLLLNFGIYGLSNLSFLAIFGRF